MPGAGSQWKTLCSRVPPTPFPADWFKNGRFSGAATAGPLVRDDGLPVFSRAKD